MRRYEQVYILRPSLSEDAITTVIDNTSQIIQEDGGTIISLDKWGMRKLAYEIKKEAQGYYVFSDFAATADSVAEIERKFRIDDAVLKYMTVKLADAITAEEISTAQSEAALQANKRAEEERVEAAADSEETSKATEETSSESAATE